MQKIPVGVQLYSVREDCARDLPATLQAIAKMGYAGVEFAGYYHYDAASLRRLLDDSGLQCCGAHIGVDQLQGAAFEPTVAFHQTLGNRYLIVPSISQEMRSSEAAWRDTAAVFSQVAEKLAPYGMLTGYHNHNVEFSPLNGETGLDIFCQHTHPAVILQFDLGNAMHAEADPLAYLRRYPSRLGTIHLKEHSASNPQALLGEGDVPWQQVFDLCEGSGSTQWYIVEQESYPVSPLESIARCRQALAKMGR